MKKQKESSEDTDKLLYMEKDLEKKKYFEKKKWQIYNLQNRIWLWLMLFVVLFTLYICYENYNNKYIVEMCMPKTKEQPITMALVDFDTLNETNNSLENMKFIENSALILDKENETSVGDVGRAIDSNSRLKFLKKLIKVSLDQQKHANEKTNEPTLNPKNSKEHRNNINSKHNSQELEDILLEHFYRALIGEEHISSVEHVLDDLVKDDEDSYYDNSNDSDDDYISKSHDTFSSEHSFRTFSEEGHISSEEHVLDDLLKDDEDSYYDVFNDSENYFVPNPHNKFLFGRSNWISDEELISSEKRVIDDLREDDGDSHYDDSNGFEDDYISKSHDTFSSEHSFRTFSEEGHISSEEHVLDDLLKDDEDSYYDDSNDFENYFVSNPYNKFLFGRSNWISDEELISSKKRGIDDLREDDGDSHYDDSNDFEDDYVSKNHDTFSSEHSSRTFSKEHISSEEHVLYDLLKNYEDSYYDDFNDSNDD